MKIIELTQGQVALIDDEDFEWLNQWKWTACKGRNTYYAVHEFKINGKRKLMRMHQMIAEKLGFKYRADHKDQNGLNNQRSNLRDTTNKQNLENASLRSDNTSGHVGVSFNKARQKYEAYINHNGKRIRSFHKYKKDAVAARIAAEKKYWTHGKYND